MTDKIAIFFLYFRLKMNQNHSQSKRGALLLVADIAGYCISLTHFKLEVTLS